MKGQLKGRIFRYGSVPVIIGLAVLLSELFQPFSRQSVDYLFLSAVVVSGWLGGRGPGVFAALLAPLVLDYFFLPPVYSLGIGPAVAPYIIPFLLSALASSWLTSSRWSAHEAITRLEQNEAKFRRVLSNLPDIFWTVDQTGRTIYISPKIEAVFGFTSEEIRSDTNILLLDRVHPECRSHLADAFRALFEKHTDFDEEFRVQRKDGVWVWVHCKATGTHVTSGVHYADGVISDITRRKSAEIELQSKSMFLEAQANSTVDGILVVDANGHKVLQNQRMTELFGIPAEIAVDVDDRRSLQHVLGVVKNPESFLTRVEYLYAHPGESSRDEIELTNGTILDRHSAPVVDSAGKYYGRIWDFRDDTERRRNEDTLRQLSAAVEQSPNSIVITDPHGNIGYVNRKFTESTGYLPEEVLGKNPRILNSGHSAPETYAMLWQTILDGKEWRGEFRNKKKNGEIYWESAAISPIVDSNGTVTHLLAIKEDITERRAMESELRQAQKLEGIGQLAAGIAHEINTPTQFVTDNLSFLQDSWRTVFQLLASYKSVISDNVANLSPGILAELAQAEQNCDLEFLDEEIPHAIDQGLDGARRVAKIVRAMKEFSHPDSADKTETDLNKGIVSTITVARNEWKYVAEIVTKFDDDLPLVVCYPGDVNQVVLNLLVNAAHSIKDKVKGSEKGTITICTRKKGEYAEIAISDTGMGIPKEIQARIFEPFFTTKEVGKGTGQGLALAHGVIAKKHQGKIWFETETGQGTTFFINIPFTLSPVKAEQ